MSAAASVSLAPLRGHSNCSKNGDSDALDDSGCDNDLDFDPELDLGDLTGSQEELRRLHARVREERKREQEASRLEQQRLDEILSLCEAFEKHQQQMQQGRIEFKQQASLDGITRLSSPPRVVSNSPRLSASSTALNDHHGSGSALSLSSSERLKNSKIITNGSLTMLASPLARAREGGNIFDFSRPWKRESSPAAAGDPGPKVEVITNNSSAVKTSLCKPTDQRQSPVSNHVMALNLLRTEDNIIKSNSNETDKNAEIKQDSNCTSTTTSSVSSLSLLKQNPEVRTNNKHKALNKSQSRGVETGDFLSKY